MYLVSFSFFINDILKFIFQEKSLLRKHSISPYTTHREDISATFCGCGKLTWLDDKRLSTNCLSRPGETSNSQMPHASTFKTLHCAPLKAYHILVHRCAIQIFQLCAMTIFDLFYSIAVSLHKFFRRFDEQ